MSMEGATAAEGGGGLRAQSSGGLHLDWEWQGWALSRGWNDRNGWWNAPEWVSHGGGDGNGGFGGGLETELGLPAQKRGGP